MKIELTKNEARIIGCLMEKSVTTPDQYPLTLNALTNACNQKSSREPVMNLDQGEVQHTIRQLEEKRLIMCNEGFKSRTQKYTQRFCNTAYADLQFSEAEFALICLLLLRGPQTPGELRTRSGRLHSFESNQDVNAALQSLIDAEKGAVVARLPRVAGRQDHQYMHLFYDEIESVEADEIAPTTAQPASTGGRVAELENRVAALETELAEVKEIVELLMDK